MSNVQKVILTKDYSIFGKIYFKDTKMFVETESYREPGYSISWHNVYSEEGEQIGRIKKNWFDFGDNLFEKAVD